MSPFPKPQGIKIMIAQLVLYVPDSTEDAEVESIIEQLDDEVGTALNTIGRTMKEKFPVISGWEADT